MKIVNNLYTKAIQVLRREIKKEVQRNFIIESIKAKALSNTESIIAKGHRTQKIIISLTTFGKRIHSVYLTLESLSSQTLKADKIIIWLAEDEFNRDNIPITLLNMQKRGLEIKFCRDYKSYKKIIPTLKEYPDEIIITVDDDMIYPYDFIEQMYHTHLKFPDCICCNRAHRIKFDKFNNLLPYNEWDWDWNPSQAISEPAFHLFPTGAGGILYFPNCFDKEVLNEENFMKLAPTADDVWLKLMSLKNNVKCKLVDRHNSYGEAFIALDSSLINSLAEENVIDNQNDVQLKAVTNHYNIEIPLR